MQTEVAPLVLPTLGLSPCLLWDERIDAHTGVMTNFISLCQNLPQDPVNKPLERK